MWLALIILLQSFEMVMVDKSVGGPLTVMGYPDIVLNRGRSTSTHFLVTIPADMKRQPNVKFKVVDLPNSVKAKINPSSCKRTCTVHVVLTGSDTTPVNNFRPSFQGNANGIESRLVFNLTVR